MRIRLGLFAGLVACWSVLPQGLGAEPETANWVKIADHAAWAPRDSCGELVLNGKMWLLGGWFSVNGMGPNDVWSSSDGRNWMLVTASAPWIHGDLPTTLVFDNKMWLMGGWYGDHKPFASSSNQVWSSSDGAAWHCATKAAAWSPRLGAGGVVFKGRMWILGGIDRYFDGEKFLRNDVWSSTDGVQWTQATEHAPWAPRAFHGAVVFADKMWVFGGGNYKPQYFGFNDVWSSGDGVHWTKVIDQAPWAPRIWFSAEVYKNRMWLLGGWSDKPSRNYNDVWCSEDGATWQELPAKTVWSKRHEQSAYVFQDKLWIVGGNAWPLVNDVWQLDR